ncbi:MAG: hypothetical protein AB1765_10135 [Candidatus Hydrogenedentota bacterium]
MRSRLLRSCALHYGVLGFLGYCVIAFLRSTQRMKNQMFVYLASCFLLLFDIIRVTTFFRGGLHGYGYAA